MKTKIALVVLACLAFATAAPVAEATTQESSDGPSCVDTSSGAPKTDTQACKDAITGGYSGGSGSPP